MACVYVYTDSNGKTRKYKTINDFINNHHSEIWNEFVDYMSNRNNIAADSDIWYGKEMLDSFKNYVYNEFKRDVPREDNTISEETQEFINRATDIEHTLTTLETLAIEGHLYNEEVIEMLKAKVENAFNELGSRETSMFTEEGMYKAENIINSIANELIKIRNSQASEESYDAVVHDAEIMRDNLDFTNSLDLSSTFTEVEQLNNDLREDKQESANAVSALQFETNEGNSIGDKVKRASEKGFIDIEDVFTEEQLEQFNKILNLKEGDKLTAEIDKSNPRYEQNKANFNNVPIVLKRNGIKVAYLNEISVSDLNNNSYSASTFSLRNRVFYNSNGKAINLKIKSIGNTNTNIWAPRQYTGDAIGANNTKLGNAIKKLRGKEAKDSIGGFKIARVSKDKNNKKQLVNVKTGQPVHNRVKDRTNKFYVELKTIGDNSVWFPLNNATVSETSQGNDNFSKYLTTEVAHRMLEYIKAIKEYHTYLEYKRKADLNQDVKVIRNGKEVAFTDAQIQKGLIDSKNELDSREDKLHELISIGKFDNKSYFNYERNIKDIRLKALNSNSVIMEDGFQETLEIIPRINGEPLTMYFLGNKHQIDDLDSSEFYDLLHSVAKGMTRNIQIEATGVIQNVENFTVTLRNKKGDVKYKKEFKNYIDYVLKTDALLTDVGAITKNGKPISNLNMAASALFTLEVETTTSTKSKLNEELKNASNIEMTVEEFVNKFVQDLEIASSLKEVMNNFKRTGVKIAKGAISAKDVIESEFKGNYIKDAKLLKRFKELKKLGSKRTNSQNKEYNALKETNETDKQDRINNTRVQFLFNAKTNTIHFTTYAISRLKDAEVAYNNGDIDTANFIIDTVRWGAIHELVHPLLRVSFSPDMGVGKATTNKEKYAKFSDDALEIVNQILNKYSTLRNTLIERGHLTDNEVAKLDAWKTKILEGAVLPNLIQLKNTGVLNYNIEELFTYAFTDKTISTFLNDMYFDGDIDNTTKSIFQKLVDLLLNLLGITINEGSQLAKIRDLLGEHYNSNKFWETIKDSEKQISDEKSEISDEKSEISDKNDSENSKTPTGEERSISIGEKQLSNIVTIINKLKLKDSKTDFSDIENESVAEVFRFLYSLRNLSESNINEYIKGADTALDAYAVQSALQLILGLPIGRPNDNLEGLFAHYSLLDDGAFFAPNTILYNLSSVTPEFNDKGEVSIEAVTQLREYFKEIKEDLELNDIVEGDVVHSTDLNNENDNNKVYPFNLDEVARHLLNTTGKFENESVQDGSDAYTMIHDFNRQLREVGLPEVFKLTKIENTIDRLRLTIDKEGLAFINDVINNTTYTKITSLILNRTYSKDGIYLNGVFDIDRISKDKSLSLFSNTRSNVKASLLGYMVNKAISDALTWMSSYDNAADDTDAFELLDENKGIDSTVANYFGGVKNVIKLFNTRVTSIKTEEGKDMALISALPILKARTMAVKVGKGSKKREIHIPTDKFNTTGFTDDALQDIANSLVYFFGRSRRDFVLLLNKLFDDKGILSDKIKVRKQVIKSLNSIRNLYKSMNENNQYDNYIENLTTIIDDLKFRDSEIWTRFIAYLSKEVTIAEESTMSMDAIIDETIAGRNTMWGKARTQHKQTVSSNIKHLLWGNLNIRNSEDALSHMRELTSDTSSLTQLEYLIKNDKVEVSSITGLPVTIKASEVKDMLVTATSGSINKSDFINRLEEVTAIQPALYPIVEAVTTNGNEALLRKLYTAVKLQSALYVVPSIKSIYGSTGKALRFNVANIEVNPAMAIASNINNHLTNRARYLEVKALDKFIEELKAAKIGLHSNRTKTDAIVAAMMLMLKDKYKFTIRKAITKAIRKDKSFVSNFEGLLDSYITSLSYVSYDKDAKRELNKHDPSSKKDVEVSEFKLYHKGIKVFKVFNDIAYYFPLDSFYTTVDLTTAYSHQLPNYLTETIDVMNNEEGLLELGEKWYNDPAMRYNRLFNTLFTVTKGKVKIKDKNIIGSINYALLGGSINEDLSNRIEYESLLGKDWTVSQMLFYLSDYMLMNSSSDASRIYGISIPNNKFKFRNRNEFNQIYEFVQNRKQLDSIIKNPAFIQIRNILYGEINEMIVARNAFFNIDNIDGTLEVKDNVNPTILLQGVHKNKKGELLDKNGKTTGKVFTFDSLNIKHNGVLYSFEDFLAEEGINFMPNGAPLFNNEQLYNKRVESLEEAKKDIANKDFFDAVDSFIGAYIKSLINDRIATINQYKDQLLEIRKSEMSEVNNWYNESEMIIHPEQIDINRWAYSFIIDELLSNFDWNKVFQGDTIEFGPAIKQSKRLSQIGRPGEAILSDASMFTMTIKDASTESNLLKLIHDRLPQFEEYYKGAEGIKDEAASDGMTYMTRKGFEKFIKEQGLEDKYAPFLEALDSQDYNSDAFKYGIQSLKTFYFNRDIADYGNGYMRMTSEQIKHSIFVLTEDFAYSKDQRDLIKFMDRVGLDMIDFASAEKVGVTSEYELMDPKTKRLKDVNNINYADIAYYIKARPVNKYRIQLQLPQHGLDYSGKVATQLKRQFENLEMDNRIYDIEGQKFTGAELFKMYQHLFALNIEEESLALYKEFGVEMHNGIPIRNEQTGSLSINNNAIYNFIQSFVTEYYNEANLMEVVGIDDNGQTKLPVWFTTIAGRLQQRIVARIREQILQQKQVGAHAAIVANTFVNGSFDTLDNVDSSKITFRKDYLDKVKNDRNGDMTLHIEQRKVKQADGTTKKMLIAEAIISTPSGKFASNGKLLSIDELYEADPKVLQMLAHRIPIEGEQSMIMIDVVGIMHNKASHVILPDDVAVKSGADFDIDTSYMMSYNLEYYNGKIRTIPYYDKITDENIDYLYDNYINNNMTDLLRNNLKAIRNDFNAQMEAQIHDDRALTNEEFKIKLKELFEDKTKYTEFFNLPEGLQESFKVLEKDFKSLGYKGFKKFELYVNLVDSLTIVLAMSRSAEQISESTINDLIDEPAAQVFLNDAYNNFKTLSDREFSGLAYTLDKLQKEYNDNLKHYRNKLDDLLNDHIANQLAIKEGRWKDYQSNLSDALNEMKKNLMTKDEFKKIPIEEINSKLARQNRLLDITASIITSDNHFENVMKVNEFPDTENAAKATNKLWGNDLSNLDHNNGNDREVLKNLNSSAKKLKGNSIAFDRTMSILRPVNAEFANFQIPVPIAKADLKARNITMATLEKKYGKGNITEQGDHLVIMVSKLGNNLTGDGTTIFGTNIFEFINQATAHILDSASRATSKNLNEYTLGVYKLLSITGITNLVDFTTKGLSKSEINTKGATETAYYYADLFINHPAVVEIAAEFLDRTGILANSKKSTDTSIIVRDMKNRYIQEMYTQLLELNEDITIDEIENNINKNKGIKSFDILKIDSTTLNTILNKLSNLITAELRKLEPNADNVSLVRGVPTITSIENEIKYEVKNANTLRSLANKFAYLDHWATLREQSNHITQITGILKQDSIELTDSAIIKMDYNIGENAFNHDVLLEELIRLSNTDIRYSDFMSEFNRFKQLTNKEKYNKVYNEYRQAGMNIKKLYKFTVNGQNLIESILPSAFGLEQESSYESLNTFYKYGVELAKSISNSMFAYNFPVGKMIINTITKNVTNMSERNIKTAINWFNGWLATSSNMANMQAHEKYRIMSLINEQFNIKFKGGNNNFTIYRSEEDFKANVPLTEIEIEHLTLLEKINIVKQLGDYVDDYTFITDMRVTNDKNFPDNSFIKLLFPSNISTQEAQRQITAMYYDNANPIFKSLVEDLYKYSFLKDGLVFGNKISKFLPFKFLTTPGFMGQNTSFGQELHIQASKLHTLEDLAITGMGEINRAFHQSNWNNPSFVPNFYMGGENDIVIDLAKYNRDLANLKPKQLLMAKKSVIDNHKLLRGKAYIKDGHTDRLYELIRTDLTADTQQSDYYFYREIERRDTFEYSNTYVQTYKVNDIETLNEAVSLVLNGTINIPFNDGNVSSLKKANGTLLNTSQVGTELTPFDSLGTHERVEFKAEGNYNTLYSLNVEVGIDRLERIVATSSDISIVVDTGQTDIQTDDLQNKLAASKLNNKLFRVGGINSSSFIKQVSDIINNNINENDAIKLSIHIPSTGYINDLSDFNVVDMLNRLANDLTKLPMLTKAGHITLLMANNPTIAGPISSVISDIQFRNGYKPNVSDVINSNVLFSKGFRTYNSNTQLETDDTYDYTDNEGNVYSMDLSNPETESRIDDLRVNQEALYMGNKTNKAAFEFINAAAKESKAKVKSVSAHITDIVGKRTNVNVDDFDKRAGSELHSYLLPIVKDLLDNVKPETIENAINIAHKNLIAKEIITSNVTAADLLKVAGGIMQQIDSIRTQSGVDVHEAFTELVIASLNPNAKNGSTLTTGSIDLFDMNNKGGTVFDIKFSSSTTKSDTYAGVGPNESFSARFRHALQGTFYARMLEVPAMLRYKGINLKAPRISPDNIYLGNIKTTLTTHGKNNRPIIDSLEVEDFINLSATTDYIDAREIVRSADILPMDNTERALYKEHLKSLELRGTQATIRKAKDTVEAINAALVAMEHEYGNGPYKELIQSLTALIPELTEKMDITSLDVMLSKIINNLRDFTAFGLRNITYLEERAKYYNDPKLSMYQLVRSINNSNRFVKDMNLINKMVNIVKGAQDLTLIETEGIDNILTANLIDAYNNTVEGLTSGENGLLNKALELHKIYSQSIREYMTELIAFNSRNPKVQEFIIRNEDGSIDFEQTDTNVLFRFEDISIPALWLDSRFDHGIPFDDAIGMTDRVIKDKINHEKQMERLVFYKLLAKAYKGDDKWRYKGDTLKKSAEITKWFKDIFMAKDYDGKDTMHLVTAHNEQIFYGKIVDMIARIQIATESWEENEAKELRKKLEEEGLNENQIKYELKKARSASRINLLKEYEEFYNKYGDKLGASKVVVGEGATRVEMSIKNFIDKYTSGMNEQQKRIFLAYHGIIRDPYRKLIVLRPKSKALDKGDNIEPNKQFQRIMNDPNLKGLYDYLIGLPSKLLDFNKGIIVDPSRIPLLYNGERSNWQSFVRFMGFAATEASSTTAMTDITNKTVYNLSVPMLGLLFNKERLVFRNRRRNEKQEDYERSIVNYVNKEYGRDFTSYSEILAHNKAETLQRKQLTLEKMEYNPLKIYRSFIEESLNYKEKMLLHDQYSMYTDFLGEFAKSYVLHKGKPKKDVAKKKSQQSDEFLFESGDKSNLANLVQTYMKSKIYQTDEFKMNQTYERIFKGLRQLTSLRVMSGNIRAGVKNLTKGVIDIMSEGESGQFVDRTGLIKGFRQYRSAISEIIANPHSEETNNLAAAFIKEHNTLLEKQNEKGQEITSDVKNTADRLLMATDLAYFFNNAGEHIMQYGMYLGMLNSHRVVDGTIMNMSDYMGNLAQELLKGNLTEEELKEFETYKTKYSEKESWRPFEYTDYFGRWIINSTILHKNSSLLKKVKNIYKTEYKKLKKQKEKDFKSYKTVYESHTTKDGLLSLKKEVKLNQNEFTKFKLRVKRVNHSMHGIYNRVDASKLQTYVWGETLTQFRKWMRPNWNRWYGQRFNRTIWNEGLNTWTKGSAISMWDLAFRPFQEYRMLDKNERASVNLFKAVLRYWGQMGTMYRTMDDIDKRNIRRFMFNFSAFLTTVFAAMFAASGLDDWKKKSKTNELLYGFLMYQVSSMSMELSEFTPILGWKSIFDRFIDSPAPSLKTVTDFSKLLGYGLGEAGTMFGIPYESRFQGGPKKGRSKFNSQLMSLVPLAREVYSLRNISSIVDYYKMNDTFKLQEKFTDLTKPSKAGGRER
jgi:hypothetical protein